MRSLSAGLLAVLGAAACTEPDGGVAFLPGGHAGDEGRVAVLLPARADGRFRVEAVASGLAVSAAIVGARAVPAEIGAGRVVYRDALGDGIDVVHVAIRGGTEDHVIFPRKPDTERVEYAIELGDGVAGLRLIGRTLELLDATGAPRLRVAPPFVVDAMGVVRGADVALSGCAADVSPSPPWNRETTPPGSRTCKLRVSWSDPSIVYPAVLDPAWTVTQDLAVARDAHTATVLDTGRVLVAAGYYDESCELFDPATGTWTLTASLPAGEGRRSHAATLLPDGRVLLTGGYVNGASATAFVYEPVSGTWSPTGSLGVPRQNHSAALLADGRVLVAGGSNSGGYLSAAEIWDPVLGTFAPTGSMTYWHSSVSAVRLADGRVLVAGGTGATGEENHSELFDPATGTWTLSGDMSQDRYGHSVTMLADGRVLAAGGVHVVLSTNTAEVYDPASGAWTLTQPMAEIRTDHDAALLPDGRVLVVGGDFVMMGDLYLVDGSELFDPSTASFVSTSPLAFPRFDHTATTLPDGRVLVAGGDDPFAMDSVELFELVQSGVACGAAGDCSSGFCVDGVCCDTACDGTCVACTQLLKGSGADGACGPIAAGDPQDECLDEGAPGCGQTGECDGAGACQTYRGGPGCTPRACSSDADCASGVCDADDAICCDAICEGSCEACTMEKKGAGQDGVCGPIAKGTDPDDDCFGAPSDMSCAQISYCDGTLNCIAGDLVCPPYTCKDSTACWADCVDDAQCAPGQNCAGGVCGAAGCEGPHTLVTPDGSSKDCRPYVCDDAEAACKEACTSVAECSAPNVCTEGACKPAPPPPAGDDGCGCRTPQSSRAGHTAALLVGLFALFARARRRGPRPASFSRDAR